MRKLLNNPAVVLPLAIVALLWVAYSYGLMDRILNNFRGKTEAETVQPLAKPDPIGSASRTEKAMKNLTGDRWLIRSWVKSTIAKNEPFVANGLKTKPELPALELEPETERKETVIVDKETFQAALVSRLGLDREGFFVVFENILNEPVRKRVGEVIYFEGSGPLVIPTLGIPERKRSAQAVQHLAKSTLASLTLLGVGTEGSEERGGASSEDSMAIAMIQLPDGQTEVFKQGDLVVRNPHLGLDQVIKDVGNGSVILVDQHGNEYPLESVD